MSIFTYVLFLLKMSFRPVNTIPCGLFSHCCKGDFFFCKILPSSLVFLCGGTLARSPTAWVPAMPPHHPSLPCGPPPITFVLVDTCISVQRCVKVPPRRRPRPSLTCLFPPPGHRLHLQSHRCCRNNRRWKRGSPSFFSLCKVFNGHGCAAVSGWWRHWWMSGERQSGLDGGNKQQIDAAQLVEGLETNNLCFCSSSHGKPKAQEQIRAYWIGG